MINLRQRIFIYIILNTHTHTHTHIHIYIHTSSFKTSQLVNSYKYCLCILIDQRSGALTRPCSREQGDCTLTDMLVFVYELPYECQNITLYASYCHSTVLFSKHTEQSSKAVRQTAVSDSLQYGISRHKSIVESRA